MYRIDMSAPVTAVPKFVPCTFVQSTRAPGKLLCVNEDGSSLVVEPDGSQTRTVPAGGDNFDSAYTQATAVDGYLIYRSADGANPGVPRAYRMIR